MALRVWGVSQNLGLHFCLPPTDPLMGWRAHSLWPQSPHVRNADDDIVLTTACSRLRQEKGLWEGGETVGLRPGGVTPGGVKQL